MFVLDGLLSSGDRLVRLELIALEAGMVDMV